MTPFYLNSVVPTTIFHFSVKRLKRLNFAQIRNCYGFSLKFRNFYVLASHNISRTYNSIIITDSPKICQHFLISVIITNFIYIQELPETKKGEAIDEYWKHTKEEIQEWKSTEYRKILEKETRTRQKTDEARQKIIQPATRKMAEENARLKKEAEKAKAEADKARDEKETNLQIVKDVISKIRILNVGMKYIRKYQHLLDVTQYCKESMPEFVEKMKENFSIMKDVYAQRNIEHSL